MADTSDTHIALQQAQNPQQVWEAIKNILADLTRLEVTTVVKGYTHADQSQKDIEIHTSIDLLQVDRKYEIHESFVKDPVLEPLRLLHEEQVKLADQEVQKRFDFAQQLGTALVHAIQAASE
jgi:hypothetical protein